MTTPPDPAWARGLDTLHHAGRDAARELAHRAGLALAASHAAAPSEGPATEDRTGTGTGCPAPAHHDDAAPHGPSHGRGAPCAATERVPLDRACGRVLAEDVRALCPVPHYASSAMDGYAVNGPGPWTLLRTRTTPREGTTLSEDATPSEDAAPLDGAALPSEASAVSLTPGTAVPVVTGGVIPQGTTGVVREEYTAREGDRVALRADAPRSELAGRHIRPAGTECGSDEVVFSAGRRLSPADAAFAAVAGLDALPVRRVPRVALLLTGSEVRTSGVPGPGHVRDAFSMSLPHVLRAHGAAVGTVQRIDDDPAALEAAVRTACADHDLVLTTGGTARSGADHVRPLLARDTRLLLDQLDLQPGHPALLGAAERSAVLALPGNPLGAVVVLLLVGGALLAGLSGRPAPQLLPVTAGAAAGGRSERLVPARRRDGAWVPCRAVGSNMLRGLSEADGLLCVPRGGLEPGDSSAVLALPW